MENRSDRVVKSGMPGLLQLYIKIETVEISKRKVLV